MTAAADGSGPEAALRRLAALLRDEETVISEHVVEPAEKPALGPLVAAGPRAAEAPGEYSLVVESIREGYLLHYATPRLLAGQDEDLSLLAGDYLYALGLERLAAVGDGEAVRELSDLISLCAASHTEGFPDLVPLLWVETALAVGCGAGEAHRAAVAAARVSRLDAARMLRGSALSMAAAAGLQDHLERAAEAIDFAIARPADRG